MTHYYFQCHRALLFIILILATPPKVESFTSLIPSHQKSPASLLVGFLSSHSKNEDKDSNTVASFQFVPYGSSILKKDHDETFYISCDGKVPGDVDLELTHWTNNVTPDEYYSDTSTEIALKYLQNKGKRAYDEELIKIINNHYDTDGVLSVWVCLQKSSHDITKEWRRLLTDGAEAGDFGEWASDEGVKLDCALSELLEKCGDEEIAYLEALNCLPKLLESLSHKRDDMRDLWEVGFDNALEDWHLVQKNEIKLSLSGCVVLVEYEVNRKHVINCYALDRALRSMGLGSKDNPGKVTRILHVFSDDKGEFNYVFQKPGYGWVKRLVDRKSVSDLDVDVVGQLNSKFKTSNWKEGGGGLTSLCYTNHSIKTPPKFVIKAILDFDKHAS